MPVNVKDCLARTTNQRQYKLTYSTKETEMLALQISSYNTGDRNSLFGPLFLHVPVLWDSGFNRASFGVRGVAFSSIFHEQTHSNRVCCFQTLDDVFPKDCPFRYFQRIPFSDYCTTLSESRSTFEVCPIIAMCVLEQFVKRVKSVSENCHNT